MSAIKLLSKEISELIAAGEVIERPASVIKELVENSIDAGAKHITVEIKNGGVTYMRVTDDGCVIAFDEVPVAFLRHATSKINSKDDLNKIYTLGFRGEALASVAAVSKAEIMTKPNDDEYGTRFCIDGSNEVLHEKCGCPNGTTIIIRDIFYNVPARAKFMKKDVTEANAVSQAVQKAALSHPEISFKLIRDNRLEFHSAGDGRLYSAAYAIYGKDFANDLIPVDYEYNNIRVTGYVIKPLYARSNRTFQNFFVNGRYIRSKICSAAVENAYSGMIMTGKFPACIIMIDISAANTDVNIHPAKAEIRFTDEKSVTDAVYFAVKNSLMGKGLIYELGREDKRDYKISEPQDEIKEDLNEQMIFTPIEDIPRREEEIISAENAADNERPAIIPSHVLRRDNRSAVISGDDNIIDDKNNKDKDSEDEDIKYNESPEIMESFKYLNESAFAAGKTINQRDIVPYEDEPSDREEFPDVRAVGEVFGLYVICESGGRMIIIDKHAAHERIIFERLKSRNCRQYSQKLLVPVKILLAAEEFDAIENNTELLKDMGFEFDLTNPPCVSVTSVPSFAMSLEIEGIIQEISENLILYKHDPQSHALDDMLHTMACKAAIKANDKNTPQEMQSLAEQVCYDERIRHCPHGRPVMFVVKKSSIDHKFKRT